MAPSSPGARFKPLGFFLQRARVLAQYRSMFRAASHLGRADPARARDIKAQIRDTFRRHREEGENFVIKQLLAEGRHQLTQIEALASDALGATSTDQYAVGQGWPWARDDS